jgi:hypothetical protein
MHNYYQTTTHTLSWSIIFQQIIVVVVVYICELVVAACVSLFDIEVKKHPLLINISNNGRTSNLFLVRIS